MIIILISIIAVLVAVTIIILIITKPWAEKSDDNDNIIADYPKTETISEISESTETTDDTEYTKYTDDSLSIVNDTETMNYNAEESEGTGENSQDSDDSKDYDNSTVIGDMQTGSFVSGSDDENNDFLLIDLGMTFSDAYWNLFNEFPENDFEGTDSYHIVKYIPTVNEDFCNNDQIKDNYFTLTNKSLISDLDMNKYQAKEIVKTDSNGKVADYYYEMAIPSVGVGESIASKAIKQKIGSDGYFWYDENQYGYNYIAIGNVSSSYNGHIIAIVSKLDADHDKSTSGYSLSFQIFNDGSYNNWLNKHGIEDPFKN